MTDTDNVDSVPPEPPTAAMPEPSPDAGASDSGPSQDESGETSDAEAMRAFMAEYRADKKAREDAAAEAAAKKKRVPAPEPKKKVTPPKEEAPKDETPKPKAYGSARYFNRKVKKSDD